MLGQQHGAATVQVQHEEQFVQRQIHELLNDAIRTGVVDEETGT